MFVHKHLHLMFAFMFEHKTMFQSQSHSHTHTHTALHGESDFWRRLLVVTYVCLRHAAGSALATTSCAADVTQILDDDRLSWHFSRNVRFSLRLSIIKLKLMNYKVTDRNLLSSRNSALTFTIRLSFLVFVTLKVAKSFSMSSKMKHSNTSNLCSHPSLSHFSACRMKLDFMHVH